MKNRIWKQIKQITVAAAVAGTVLFGSVQPGMAADSELQSDRNCQMTGKRRMDMSTWRSWHRGNEYAKRMKRGGRE